VAATPGNSILIEAQASITCPHCRKAFSLEEGFAEAALEGALQKSQSTLTQFREEARALADKRTQAQLSESNRAHEQEIGAMRDSLRKLQAEQLQLREERQRLKDEKATLDLEVQRRIDQQLGQREAQVRAKEQERSALEKAELQKKLEDVTNQMSELQRRAEQGSQQLQGEVLELALEEALRREFPLDQIEEVKKGQRGGDLIQRVISRSGAAAGVMVWETKRAQAWSAAWLVKLKEDMRGSSADYGVLVTMPGAVPKEWDARTQFGYIDGVWVTVWGVAVQLAEVLRAALLDVHKQRVASAGKDQKMEALYDYITSPQFAQKLRAVNDVYQRLQEELDSEKNSTLQRWSRREKQLQSAKLALLGLAGEIQGLAQQELPQLELDMGH
jgi:hypothetical protein